MLNIITREQLEEAMEVVNKAMNGGNIDGSELTLEPSAMLLILLGINVVDSITSSENPYLKELGTDPEDGNGGLN